MSQITHFYLGANSGRGFASLYGPWTQREGLRDLMVLKGGPGVGKSTFLRRLGAAAEERGADVEYIHCSGDPDSLDGVWLPGYRAAAVDGTSPHAVEPDYPPAVGRYLDLGRFYDVDAVKLRRSEVVRWTDACRAAYAGAYHCFGAAAALRQELRRELAPFFDGQRLAKRFAGLARRELRGSGRGGGAEERFLGGPTCLGELCRFDTVDALCGRVCELQDSWGLGGEALESLAAEAGARGHERILCRDPDEPDRLRHLLLPGLGLAFVTSGGAARYPGTPCRRIRVDALLDRQAMRGQRGKLRLHRELWEGLRREGLEELAEAKRCHDRLEAVYRPHVDFAGLDALTESELRRVFGD